MWFADTFGFKESRSRVYRKVRLAGGRLVVDGVPRWKYGTLSCSPGATTVLEDRGPSPFTVIQADVADLHRDPANAHALFQVASQANMLEMSAPWITPEDGISRYERDDTQGPACAMACGAGTLWRAYFMGGGQTAARQANLLSGLGHVQNGYFLPTKEELRCLSRNPGEIHTRARIGVMLDTEVTSVSGLLVDQAYTTAAPVAYSQHPLKKWRKAAEALLDVAYGDTLDAAYRRRSTKVFLTRVGGGVFGNPPLWVEDALERALERHHQSGLEIYLVEAPPLTVR